MIDLFESIIKTHTVVILGEYFKQNKYSNAAKGLLASGLRTPSLGTWQLFSRVLYKELAAENHVFFQEDFAKEFEKLDKDLENQKTNVISFRNEYAHGATPSDELCSEDIKRFEPFLESLLASKWLANSTLLELEGKVFISNSSAANLISLYPILLYKPEPNAQPYVFFNDLKNDKVGLLNYPLSKHYKEKDFFQEFNTYLPLKEWKNSGSSEFHQRIEELTETFKGRTQERLRIKDFIEKKDKGYFSIQGNPGIGKSALIAQLFKDLFNQTPKLPIKLVEYFIRRGTAQANSTYLLNYLLKATDNYFSEGKTIQAEGKTNWDLQLQLFAKWRAYGDANPKEKLVFFIDGLDEGVENDILRYLPRENFKDIIVIYGSRPGGHRDIEAFWTELPVEHHQPLLLTGLSKNDIRALLYEVGNKYEIEKDSAWIDTVEKRSEGNPLYLKLLCNAIENGSIPYNDPKALPTEINDYYKAILARYANESQDGDALLSSLFVFAAAFDYLTPMHLQLINGFGTAQSIRIESTLKEVLYENPLTEEVLDYQLFHESFREFLVQFYPTELKRAETKLLEFCSTWNTLQHTFEQRYALQHYTSHLTQSSTEQSILTLINLSKNKAYTDTQKKVLRGFIATKQLYQEIIHHTIKSASTDEALEAALALVDLKYEEQNDTVSILAMVANNEIDLALQRITAFGGESKEDKQRQFILYMLCFMELTLLASKTQPWRKLAIKKLLAQFEEQIPIDHSLVNWDNFFPSYLMFLIACEWAQMGLDYLIIYKRTDSWKSDWVSQKAPYTGIQFEVLLASAQVISYDFDKSRGLASIATQLAKQG
ncbi:NACHT domain-containing protein, partial [Flavobacterium sp.]|uniref:NACHT domain-containing protein n=1 Tax=Flavobacterium sp. TaxID=239 RepID=UPI00261BC6FE